jgi:peptidoglycan hydrolase-like protein with peptidoglycan-binding domain
MFAAVTFVVAGCGSTKPKVAATTTTTAAATTTTTAVKITTTTAPIAPIPTTTVTTVASSIPSGFTKESPTGSLAQGDFGPRVAAMQKKLKAIGNDPGPADGAFGEQTVKAVKAFQTAKALKADGIVGPQTQAAIDAACSKASC